MENTYWNSNGEYTHLLPSLEALIPVEGSVDNPRKNKALEKFRKASNCYYDLYNNGLCNRRAEFRQVFGFSAGKYSHRESYWQDGRRYTNESFSSVFYKMVEEKMSAIILAAAMEHGIPLGTDQVTDKAVA